MNNSGGMLQVAVVPDQVQSESTAPDPYDLQYDSAHGVHPLSDSGLLTDFDLDAGYAPGGARPRIGVMGGTFDPIHHGHLVAASEVAATLGLDEVIFVPTGKPSFKQDKHVTAPEHRYLMTVIATASNPKFTVSRVDIDRPGLTYTVDTLADLRQLHPSANLFFITGADAVAQILTWKDTERLWDLAKFVAVGRPGHVLALPSGIPPGAISTVEIPAMAISSTDIRHRAAVGKPIWYLVPDGVVQYINKYHLYRNYGTSGEERHDR